MNLVQLGLRNFKRKKARSFLTVVAIAISVIAFVFMRTVTTAWTKQSEASTDIIVTRHKVAMALTLPFRYAQEIRALPHISGVYAGLWFGGHVPHRDNEFFPSGGIEAERFLEIYEGQVFVPADQKSAWLKNRNGAMVGKATAERFGWKVGDTVNLETGFFPRADGQPWSFTVEAIYTTSSSSLGNGWFYVHYAAVNDTLSGPGKDQAAFIVSKADTPGRAAAVASEIDSHFETSEIATVSQDEQSFTKSNLASMSAILEAVNVISLIIMVLMGLILGNTIAMSVRERLSEYGTLRAIGFSSRAIVTLIISESVGTSALGALVGLVISVPFIQFGVGPGIKANLGSFFSSFDVPPGVVGIVVALSLTFGIAAAALPALRAVRLKTVDALRNVI